MNPKEREPYFQTQRFKDRHDELRAWKEDHKKEREAAQVVHQASDDPEVTTMNVGDFLSTITADEDAQVEDDGQPNS